MPRSYSREEVQAILGRALEQQSLQHGDALSHAELLAIGRDLGVPEGAIESAANAVGDELAVTKEVAAGVRRARRGLSKHLLSFVLVNALLLVINLTTGGPLWFPWSVLGWGIGLVFHAKSAFWPDRDKLVSRARRRLEREHKRERKEERQPSVRVAQPGVRVEPKAEVAEHEALQLEDEGEAERRRT